MEGERPQAKDLEVIGLWILLRSPEILEPSEQTSDCNTPGMALGETYLCIDLL